MTLLTDELATAMFLSLAGLDLSLWAAAWGWLNDLSDISWAMT